MKTLFIVRSYYMLIVALQLRMTVYEDSIADFIMSDDCQNSEKIFEEIKKKGVFNNCWYIKNNEFIMGTSVTKKAKNLLDLYTAPDKLLKDYNFDIYDNIIVYNIYRKLEDALYCYCKKKNPKIKFFMYEEGYISYLKLTGYHTQERGRLKLISDIHKLFCKTFKLGPKINDMAGFYFFQPEMVMYESKIPFLCIPRIDRNNVKIKQLLNDVFGVSDYKKIDEYKVIYFETTVLGTDEEKREKVALKVICDVCGENNIIIKPHPRVSKGIFKELGISSEIETPVPWELIAMNIQIDKKIIITVSSTAAFTASLLFGDRAHVILLSEYIWEDSKLSYKDEMREFVKNFRVAFSDIIVDFPKSENELTELLKNIKEVSV